MMDRIAVVLRGHIRNWEYTHPAVFDFWDKIARHVDYYFVTWSHGNNLHYFERAKTKFDKRNLIYSVYFPKKDEWYNGYTAASRMCYDTIPYMKVRQEEIGKYDAVFDTRPDVLYTFRNTNLTPLIPEPNTLYTSGIFLQKCNREETHVSLDDHFFMATFETFCNYNQRHADSQELNYGAQIGLGVFLEKNKININVIDWILCEITRPCAALISETSIGYFYSKLWGSKRSQYEWIHMAKEDKLNWCEKWHVDPEDYITSNESASI